MRCAAAAAVPAVYVHVPPPHSAGTHRLVAALVLDHLYLLHQPLEAGRRRHGYLRSGGAIISVATQRYHPAWAPCRRYPNVGKRTAAPRGLRGLGGSRGRYPNGHGSTTWRRIYVVEHTYNNFIVNIYLCLLFITRERQQSSRPSTLHQCEGLLE
jgi:hypothetical protein